MTRQTSSDSPGGSKAKKFLYTGPKKKGPGGLFDDETAAPIPSYGNVASPSTENVSDIWKNISLNTTPRAAPKPSTQEGWSRNVERGFYSRHGMMADGATTNPQQQSQQPQQSQQQQTFSYSNSNNTTLQQSNSNSKFDVDKKNVNNQNIYAGGRYGMQHRGGATNGMQYRGGTNRPF